jgi:hypothetical protein
MNCISESEQRTGRVDEIQNEEQNELKKSRPGKEKMLSIKF